MDIEEMKKLKFELELEISKMVIEFYNKTGVVVESIGLPYDTVETVENFRERGRIVVYRTSVIEVSL